MVDAESAIGAIATEISRIEGIYEKWTQKHGIPYGVVQILYVLKMNDSVTQKYISEVCEIPKQTINRIIKELQANNYIELVSSAMDKREKKVRLTASGVAYSQKLLTPFSELNKVVARVIGLETLQNLSQELGRLGDVLEKESNKIK